VRANPSLRKRAEVALKHMTASELMRCGLTCDFTSECMAFLRQHFDVEDPDAALFAEAFRNFSSRQKALFIDGYILSDPASLSSAPGSGIRDQGSADWMVKGPDGTKKSATQLVFEEVEHPEPCFGYDSGGFCFFTQFGSLQKSLRCH